MVVTVTLASTMQITLNGSNQFIIKLSNEQKTIIINSSKRRRTSPVQQPARPGANPLFTVTNAMFICGIDSPNVFKETHRPRGFTDKYLMRTLCHAWIKQLNN